MPLIVRPNPTKPPRVRNSHIVPRFYLNKFADSTKRTFVYARGHDPKRKSTKSLCSETDYFEYEVGKEISNNRHETIFSRIEDLAGKIYSKILAGRSLDQQEVTAWALFVATLFLRSRKVRNQLAPPILEQLKESFLSPDQIRNMQHDLFKQGHFFPESELTAAVQRTLNQLRANPAFIQLSRIDKSLCNLGVELGKKQWHTLEAAPGKVFLTSDCPVITLKLTGGGAAYLGFGFGQEDVAIVLPLSPGKIFVASPPTISWQKVLDENSTDLFNRAIVRYADRAVISIEKSEQTRALVDSDINEMIFGVNAFVLPKESVS